MGQVTDFLSAGRTEQERAQRFVRITNPDHKGFVEFNFSIGDPAIYLEMVLGQPAFAEFCNDNDVVFLTEEQERAVDALEARWQFGETADSAD